MIEELLGQIVANKDESEFESDLITLCWLGALNIVRFEFKDIQKKIYLVDPSGDVAFRECIERMGKILCPLADDVKHDEYKSRMSIIRHQYRGISFSYNLQSEYFSKIEHLAEEGLLESVQIAVDKRIWLLLERNTLERER